MSIKELGVAMRTLGLNPTEDELLNMVNEVLFLLIGYCTSMTGNLYSSIWGRPRLRRLSMRIAKNARSRLWGFTYLYGVLGRVNTVIQPKYATASVIIWFFVVWRGWKWHWLWRVLQDDEGDEQGDGPGTDPASISVKWNTSITCAKKILFVEYSTRTATGTLRRRSFGISWPPWARSSARRRWTRSSRSSTRMAMNRSAGNNFGELDRGIWIWRLWHFASWNSEFRHLLQIDYEEFVNAVAPIVNDGAKEDAPWGLQPQQQMPEAPATNGRRHWWRSSRSEQDRTGYRLISINKSIIYRSMD